MASFEEILNRPASEFKAPQAFPVGTYHCIVDGPLEAGTSSQKGTPYLRAKFKILSIDKDVDAVQAAEQQIIGKIIQSDYYMTDGASYHLTEMLKALGIEGLEDGGGKSFKEAISEAPGKQLWVKLRHEASQDGKRVFHRVESTAHV